MKHFLVLFLILFTSLSYAKISDDSKIKSCLSGVYASQIKFHKAKRYFATRPEELELSKYPNCDSVEVSTHFASDTGFRMTAKFNHRSWTVDQNKRMSFQP